MFKTVGIVMFLQLTLFGGLLDFKTIENAKTAYAEGNYTKAASLYESLDDKNDDVLFNLGDAYYKAKRYEDAIKTYQGVQKPELKAKALHNIGNAYANSKKIDEAIASYEEALKLGNDEDTKYNLELLKKEKKEQQKKQNKDQKNKDQKNKDQKQKDQKNKKDQNKKDQQKKSDQNKKQDQKDQKKQKSDAQKKAEDKKKEQEKKEQEKNAKEKKDKEAKKEKAKEQKMNKSTPKEEPISDMQERKYKKMLDKRGIKTLMVPLKNKGGPHEETTAW